MAKRRVSYPPKFRRQMVDLVRSGRGPEELAQEFEPTAQAIATGCIRPIETKAGVAKA